MFHAKTIFECATLLLVLLTSTSAWTMPAGSSSGSSDSDSPEDRIYYRIDCRYHTHDTVSSAGAVSGKNPGEKFFCYASAVYSPKDSEYDFRDVHLAIGCDNRTIFNDSARVHREMTLDRFQPLQAATPAIEVFPHGQLLSEGTYTSMLDIAEGRFQGLCYVHRVEFEDLGGKKR